MTGSTIKETKSQVRARNDVHAGASEIRSGRGCTKQNKKVTLGNLQKTHM